MALETLRNSAFSAFLVGQQAAGSCSETNPTPMAREERLSSRTPARRSKASHQRRLCNGMSCQVRTRAKHGKRTDAAGDPRSELPIDAAIGWTQEDGNRAHRLAGTTVDDNMADPVHIAENLSATASPASVDLGVRSRAPTVGREMVTHAPASGVRPAREAEVFGQTYASAGVTASSSRNAPPRLCVSTSTALPEARLISLISPNDCAGSFNSK